MNTRSIENRVVTFLTEIGPWGSSFFPAYVTGLHLYEQNFPGWLAVIAAVTVGILGLSSIRTGLTFWQHNRHYKDKTKKMPLWIPLGAFSIYFVIVIVLNAILEIWPEELWARVTAIILISGLEIPGAFILGIRAMFDDLQSDLEHQREERRQARAAKKAAKEKKAERLIPAPEISSDSVTDQIADWLVANDFTPMDVGRGGPVSPKDLADTLQINPTSVRTTIHRMKNNLEENGYGER